MPRLFALAASLCLFAGIVAAESKVLVRLPFQKETSAKLAGSAAGFVPDKGKFRILLNGQTVGSEEFEISSSGDIWAARGSTTMHVPGGGDIKATGQLRLAADGTPIHYDWAAQADKKASGAVEFANGTAKTAIDLGGKAPFTQDFTFPSPRIAVLDNNLYSQYAVLARLYDWKTGGKQVIPVLIPQDMTPGSISVQALGPQRAEGSEYETLRVNSPDLEILLYVDADHRLMRLEVPASKVTIQRE